MSYINTLPDASMEPPGAPEPRCPICGSKSCNVIFYNSLTKNIVGCDDCIEVGAPENEPACFPDND